MSVAPHIKPVLDRAAAAFRRTYGRDPTLAAAAPGRVNLIGEHTDYNGGFVLPIAIDRVCVVVGTPREFGKTRIWAEDLNQSAEIETSHIAVRKRGSALGPEVEQGSWPSYIAGVMAQFQRRLTQGLPRLDLAIASSVPVGSGLSSSAALEVATATLLEQSTGFQLDPIEKALLCQAAEHDFAGVPCGIMDQFISVMGQEEHALLIDCRSQQATQVRLPPPSEAVIAVIDTGIHHTLAAGEYANRRAICESAAAKLGCDLLRDATPLANPEAGLTTEEQRCVRHVVTENARTQAAAELLTGSDLAAVGRLMNESHSSLRDDYRVSCAELDTVVDAANQVPGVYGSRMTGGGFGGCAIALVDPKAMQQLQGHVAASYRARHGRDCEIVVVKPSAGASAILV